LVPYPEQILGPPSLLPTGHWGSLPLGIKQLEHETDHWPPTSAKVMNTQSYTSTPLYDFVAQYSVPQLLILMWKAFRTWSWK